MNALAETQTYDSPAHFSVGVSATTNRITDSPYAYDANGNMTNDGNNTLAYDAENRVVSASNGSSSGTYTFDGNSLRVKKVSGSTTTVYIFSGSKVVAEYDNGAAPGSPSREYIYSGGALLAKIASGTSTYYHQDHLSNRLVTDSSGTVAEQLGTYPFGESWYNTTSEKWLFTTYERDPESQNDYAMARSYVNRVGRFSSPDPLPGWTSDPQSLNHYSYTLDDPVNLSDQVGLTSHNPQYFSGLDPSAFNLWLLDLFFQAQISVTVSNGEKYWTGEDWMPVEINPGFLLNLWWFGGTGDSSGTPNNPPCTKQASAFVSANRAYANQIAQKTGVSATNLLGLAALESNFGTSNLATNYNNYFGLTVGRAFKGTTGVHTTSDGRNFGIYPSPGFLTSGLSFAQSFQGGRVSGITDPATFAQRLTTPPLAFNSEPGYAEKLILRINQVAPCL